MAVTEYAADKESIRYIRYMINNSLKEYHILILIRMYRKGIVINKYKDIKLVEKLINWQTIKRKYSIRIKFKTIIKKLINKGLVTDNGKSYKVCSLTPMGVKVARLCEQAFPSLAITCWISRYNAYCRFHRFIRTSLGYSLPLIEQTLLQDSCCRYN